MSEQDHELNKPPTRVPTGRAVVLVHGQNQLSRDAEEDLVLAGFAVVRAPDPRRVLDEASRQDVAAMVVGEAVSDWFWRRWNRAPQLRRIPVVVLMSRRRQDILVRWPFGAFVRGDAYVSSADLKQRGAAAAAVRTVIERGGRAAPTALQRFGEALWYVGSVLSVVGLLLLPVAVAAFAMTWSRWLSVYSAMCVGGGSVLMDVGSTIGLGQPMRLRWGTWVWIVLILLAARVLFARP